jgi:subtilisin family serine protease
MSGTSMATPHVAGACALLKAVNPSLTGAQIKEALLATTDPEEAVRLHAVVTAAAGKLTDAEERWLALQEELAAFDRG